MTSFTYICYICWLSLFESLKIVLIKISAPLVELVKLNSPVKTDKCQSKSMAKKKTSFLRSTLKVSCSSKKMLNSKEEKNVYGYMKGMGEAENYM